MLRSDELTLPVRVLLLVFAVALLTGGCTQGKRIPAVGPGHEIVVLASPGSRPLAKQIAEILSAEILLVHYEQRFLVVESGLEDLSFYRTRKVLFAVGTPEEQDFLDLLQKATGERSRTDFPGLWLEREPFSAGQILFLLSGDRAALEESLANKGPELVATVERAVVELLRRNIFRAGEIEGAREKMQQHWGWGMRVPRGWQVDERFAGEKFVRIWRDAPVTQAFVSWEEGRRERSPEEWLEHRSELTWEYYEEDRVYGPGAEAAASVIPLGLPGVFLKGLWENDKYDIGGPFESWGFYCPEDGRTYLVDVSVYAPDRDKEPLLRTLRALAGTFRCACVSAPPRGSR